MTATNTQKQHLHLLLPNGNLLVGLATIETGYARQLNLFIIAFFCIILNRPIYTMKLYAVSDGPPSLAVRMALKALDIQYQLINVDFCALEHRTTEYAKVGYF